MTNKEFYREFGNIDPKMIEAAAPAEKVQKKNGWIKWVLMAACFCLAMMIAVIDETSSNYIYLAIINYGPFIFVPVLIVSLISWLISFVKKETTLQASVMTSSFMLLVINLLNILGIYLYSQFGGINIFGRLPIILISSNAGAIVSVITITLLNRKAKTWWLKLLLGLIVTAVSIVIACFLHNMIFRYGSSPFPTIGIITQNHFVNKI